MISLAEAHFEVLQRWQGIRVADDDVEKLGRPVSIKPSMSAKVPNGRKLWVERTVCHSMSC